MVFPGATRCPRCGGILLMPHELAPTDQPLLTRMHQGGPEEGSLARRLGVGLGLSVGCYLGLREIWHSIPLLGGSDPQQWSTGFAGLISLYAAQAIAVAVGGVVVAAARPHGYTLGLFLGLGSGALFFLWEVQQNAAMRQSPLLLQIPLVAWVGLLAGWVGERLWPPPPTLELPQPRSSLLSSLQFSRSVVSTPPPAPPTRWFRILAGATLAVALLVSADTIRQAVQQYSLGLFQAPGIGQAQFLSWLIALFGLLLGGVFAAAGSPAGLRHGAFTGLLAAPVVLAFAMQQDALPTPLEYTLTRAGLAGVPLSDPIAAALTLGGILAVCTLGGWFGAALFPPLAPPALRRPIRHELA
jgi:hypothetical protein